MTEEEVREKISRWKEKYENLLSSTEGRNEREDSFIVFRSIYVGKGIKPQGYVEIYGLPWKVSFTSNEKLLPTELMMEYLNKLFDEAYLFIQGARRKNEE